MTYVFRGRIAGWFGMQENIQFSRRAPCLPVVTIVLIRKAAIVVVAVGSVAVDNITPLLTNLGAAGSVELFQA